MIRALEDEFARVRQARPVVAKDGRAVLVHVSDKKRAWQVEDSLRELRELARTAGVEVVDAVTQVRDHIDPRFVLGRGKLEEVVLRALQRDAEVLIFDRDLAPVAGRVHRRRHRPQGARPHAAHPRHLRAARRHPRRQAPGRARAAEVHAPAPRAERRRAVAPHRRHRRSWPG
jgi:hypothetical protein